MSPNGRLAAGLGQNGMRYYDPHECSQLNELKV
ncbi:MAG: monomethylamine:corrinoid methyltransferase, partial [Candidatus Methanomethylophilaceae archaeon]|nr:monomethylamine:corrinoid methyltransferase [Candidatus Methanomethylophilaceae archaeon]